MKSKVLAVMHMSPPVHGASAVGDFIATSDTLKTELSLTFIPMRFASSIEDIGSFSYGKILTAAKLFLQIICALLRERPTVIYYTASSSGFAFARDLIIIFPIKLYSVWSGSSVYLHYHTKGLANFVGSSTIKKWAMYWLAWKSNAIVLSEELASEYCQFFKKESVVFLPNSVPDSLTDFGLEDVIREKYTSAKAGITFLFMANMIRSKGYERILRLAADTKDRAFTFHFAGAWQKEEDERAFWQFIEDNDLHDRVCYHGLVRGLAKAKLFSRASIFLFPTRYPKEAFPLCVLEALSFGVPVICSDEGALPSIIDDSVGRNISDLGDFTNAVISACPDLLDPRVGEECRRRYKARYSPEAFEKNMVRLLSGA